MWLSFLSAGSTLVTLTHSRDVFNGLERLLVMQLFFLSLLHSCDTAGNTDPRSRAFYIVQDSERARKKENSRMHLRQPVCIKALIIGWACWHGGSSECE